MVSNKEQQWRRLAAVEAVGVNIKLQTQPAHSLDINMNDLGFFAAIQWLYFKLAPNNEFDLILEAEAAFKEYPPKKINYIWLSLMSEYNAIIKCNGDNK